MTKKEKLFDDLLVVCDNLIFAAEVYDSSETPTAEDVNRLHDSIREARRVIVESKA